MGNIVLPLGTPLVKTYLYEANPLSILALYGESYIPWLLSNYIQLNINHNFREQNDIFLEFYGPQGFNCPFLKVQRLSYLFLKSLKIDVQTYIKRTLEEGYYLHLIIDNFFIPNTYDYRIKHYTHDILVYGYDDLNQQYYVKTYNKNNQFETIMVNYQDLKQAIQSDVIDRNMYEWSDRILTYKYNEVGRYNFNLELVKFSIREYLEGKNTLDSCNRFEPSHPERDYGIKVFDIILEYLEDFIAGTEPQGQGFDTRATNLLVEHKKLMIERMKYLKDMGVQTEELIDKYKNTYKLCKINLDLGIKYNFTHNKNLLVRMHANMRQVKLDDISILSTLMDLI